MLKAAIEKIQSMTNPIIHTHGKSEFVIDHDGNINQIVEKSAMPTCLELNSLESLAKLIETEAAGKELPLYVTVPSHERVRCFGHPQEDKGCMRQHYYNVVATDVPGWGDSVKLPFDQAAVALQTRFQESTDRAYVLQLLSQITTGAKVTYSDNGIATSVVTSKGVALQQNSTIRPLVKLRPYRTFQEVEQPEGLFLIRIDERGITFTEADGGMWKLEARNTVVKYLRESLKKYVEEGQVVVTL